MHLLVFNLQTEHISSERNTRNLQRQYRRGYLDIRLASDRSPKIAGYMAKYMAKGYGDRRFTSGRAYTTSRNIAKVGIYGTNTLDFWVDRLTPGELAKIDEYDVKYMGKCIKTTYVNKNAHAHYNRKNP